MGARQQTQYALFSAQGFRRFVQLNAAQESVEQAIRLANQFQLFQLMFEAESEMHEIEAARTQIGKEPRERPAHLRKVRARAAAGADDATDVIEAIFDRSTTRAKIPPRIRRVAESIKSMALEEAAITDGGGRFTQ